MVSGGSPGIRRQCQRVDVVAAATLVVVVVADVLDIIVRSHDGWSGPRQPISIDSTVRVWSLEPQPTSGRADISPRSSVEAADHENGTEANRFRHQRLRP